jgi:hypothetical protein
VYKSLLGVVISGQGVLRLDAPLLDHGVSPTTHVPSFLKKTAHPFISIHLFLFLSLLSAHLPHLSARPLALRGASLGTDLTSNVFKTSD